MTVKKIGDGSPQAAAKFLRENGLLFEINRAILHPLGLALEIQVDDDGTETVGGLWDYQDDPEGILYAPETYKSGEAKYNQFIRTKGGRVMESRHRVLGFAVQKEPGDDQGSEEHRDEG